MPIPEGTSQLANQPTNQPPSFHRDKRRDVTRAGLEMAWEDLATPSRRGQCVNAPRMKIYRHIELSFDELLAPLDADLSRSNKTMAISIAYLSYRRQYCRNRDLLHQTLTLLWSDAGNFLPAGDGARQLPSNATVISKAYGL